MTLCLTVAISEKKSYLPRSALKITVNIQKNVQEETLPQVHSTCIKTMLQLKNYVVWGEES